MSTSGNLEDLVARVLGRARKEAATLVERAGKAAERQVHQVQEQSRSRLEAAEAALRETAERRKHAALARARQEFRRAIMNAREAAVAEVFAAALQAIEQIDDAGAKRELLIELVTGGVRALRVPAVVVWLNAAEQALARSPEFPREIDGVRLVIGEEPIRTCGGPVVTDHTGRVAFENTFEARLERARDRLRTLVAGMLEFGDGEKTV
ncbi:MAG: hypothetical protein JXR37_20220 [Kiritimatiellae bacterium]|nr:hypothetical protein [Kiritimatiellia bacterium]